MIENHILQGARFQQTPNISPGAITPKYLIIHYSASGSTDGTVDWLCNPDSRVSAHVVIGRDGEIVQIAKFNQKAWHCGLSEWDGEEGLNDLSVGIELINCGKLTRDKDGRFWTDRKKEVPFEEVEQATHKNETEPRYWHKYTSEQLEVCANVAAQIFQTYNLKAILGHDDIAPTRKTDPGPLFPMDKVRAFVIGPGKLMAGISLRDTVFEIRGGVMYVSLSDKEGDVDTQLTLNEAAALRDWLNENLPE